MEHIQQAIGQLYNQWSGRDADNIVMLPQSGSDRMYYRLYAGPQTFIATYNLNIRENDAFIAFSKHFAAKGLPVPQVFCVNEQHTLYLQQDLGNTSLLQVLEQQGHTPHVYNLFEKSLTALAALQIQGNQGFDYNLCLTAKEFGKQAFISDLLYFKYYFLDTLKLPYDKQALLDEFDLISTYLTNVQYRFFMFRDFQSRNIIVQDDEVFFIDYQGGMKGALQYDAASLLWQAKACLSDDWKTRLLEHYINQVEKQLQQPIDKDLFKRQYNGYVLIRLLQVLGAYGFRGLFERKAHFLSSIPLALQNLKYFVQETRIGLHTPVFDSILQTIVSNDIIARFTTPKASENTPLVVTINSFSYKKGIPADDSENGGGFVFDMRGILNPGRFEEYKYLSGLDKTVQEFLEHRTRMHEFLNSVWNVVDVSVENYLERGFENLMINFGCTGGQHRSVYAAEQTARHLRNKYNVKVLLNHNNKLNWLTQPKPVQ
jgi:aminoglycoside/choline kinase family phosphotransferase